MVTADILTGWERQLAVDGDFSHLKDDMIAPDAAIVGVRAS
jgi:hypothetical protein